LRSTCALPGLLLLAIMTSSAAAAVPAGLSDRASVEQMLFATGFSGVAEMRLSEARWIGRGAHDGVVVDFIVDARTGRIVSEVPVF
jgi:hypothetical protein